MFLQLDPWQAAALERDIREHAPGLERWLAPLLADHRAHVATAQELARRLHQARLRLAAGESYFRELLARGDMAELERRLAPSVAHFDRLLREAHAVASRPWPKKLPCEHCGAPAIMVEIDTQPHAGGPVWTQVTLHPDGRRCRGTPTKR